MAMEIKKREGETPNSLIYRFNKRIQRSGLVKEVRKRQFTDRLPNKRKVRLSALYRIGKQENQDLARKVGKKSDF
jgi:ribosomal protein S21